MKLATVTNQITKWINDFAMQKSTVNQTFDELSLFRQIEALFLWPYFHGTFQMATKASDYGWKNFTVLFKYFYTFLIIIRCLMELVVFELGFWTAVFCVLLGVIGCQRTYQLYYKYRHFSGPAPSFVFGNLHDMLKYGWGGRHVALEEMHKEFGNMFVLHLPLFKQSIVVSDSLVKEAKSFDAYRVERTLCPGSLMCSLGNDYHAKSRQILNRHVKTNANFSSMIELTEKWTKKLLDEWKFKPSKNFIEDLEFLAIDIFTEFFFGSHMPHEEKHKFKHDGEVMIAEISRRSLTPPWMWFHDMEKNIELTKSLMALRDHGIKFSQDAAKNNTAYHRSCEESGKAEWERIEDAQFVITASFGSSANSIFSMLVALSQNEPVLRETVAKLDGYMKASNTNTVAEIYKECMNGFMFDIFYENQRLFPSVPFSTKKIDRSIRVGDKNFPSGSLLMEMKILVGRNKDVFDFPEEFNPSRLKNVRGPVAKMAQFMPFGSSRRQCWGQELSIRMISAAVLQILSQMTPVFREIDEEGMQIKRSVKTVANGVHVDVAAMDLNRLAFHPRLTAFADLPNWSSEFGRFSSHKTA